MPGLVVFGITGRMGQSLVRALREAPGALSLCGAIASSASARLGQDAALEGDPTGVMITADPGVGLKAAAVAVDFSLPQCVAANARACALAGGPVPVGTTGVGAAAPRNLLRAGEENPAATAPHTPVRRGRGGPM